MSIDPADLSELDEIAALIPNEEVYIKDEPVEGGNGCPKTKVCN